MFRGHSVIIDFKYIPKKVNQDTKKNSLKKSDFFFSFPFLKVRTDVIPMILIQLSPAH